MDRPKLTPREIVNREVARQAKFGMEPSWEDFVIAGMEEAKKQEREMILDAIDELSNDGEFFLTPQEIRQALEKK